MTRYTKNEAYKHVKEAIDYFGCFPTIREYQVWAKENGKIGYDTVVKLTNKKWRELKEELAAHTDKRLKEDVIIFHLKEAAKIYGDNFSKRNYMEYAKEIKNAPTINHVTTIFSTFNRAKIVAGLTPNKFYTDNRVNKHTCLNALKMCAKELEKDAFIEDEYEEWMAHKKKEGINYPSAVTIRNRFGLFSSALKKASLKTVHEITEEDVYESALEFLLDAVTKEKYNEWAKKNKKLYWENFSKRGYNFRETCQKALTWHFNKRN